jgi:DNA-binding IclR family transcriptional regulator
MEMNASHIIAVSALAFLGSQAMAQEATYEYPAPAVSQKSRAEVRAELDEARAQGHLYAGGEATPYQLAAATSGPRARADVRVEGIANTRDHVQSLTGHSSETS